MLSSEAIMLRINKLLKEHNLTVYKLSYLAGISNSIISDFKRGKVKELSLSSLIHICEGFGIELKDFFDSPYFKEVEAIDRYDKIEKDNKNQINNK